MADTFLDNSKSDLPVASLTELKSISLHEISKHNTKEDLWVILNAHVYDITSMLHKHPGGEDIILNQITRSKCHDLTQTFHKLEHSANAIDFVKGSCLGRVDKEVLVWSDLFCTKVELLDYQHGIIITLMNDIFCHGRISDLHQLIALWNIHVTTEEYLMKKCKFANDKQLSHIRDHERITNILDEYYKTLVEKYTHQLNTKQSDASGTVKREKTDTDDEKEDHTKGKEEEFECAELKTFIKTELVPAFKAHGFEYDSLYVDKWGDTDPSIGIECKVNELGLMQPILPNINDIEM
eukprot:30687_1